MHRILHGEPMAPMFPIGTVLWRGVAHFAGRDKYHTNVELYEHNFKSTEKGTYLASVVVQGGSGDFIYEPVVVSSASQRLYGIALFVNKMPPTDWTHLIVTGVSKAMRQPYNVEEGCHRAKGCAVFAEVPRPYNMDDYIGFRERYYSAMTQDLDADFNTRVAIALNIWTDEVRFDERRLLSLQRWRHPEVLLDYCHLRRNEEYQ